LEKRRIFYNAYTSLMKNLYSKSELLKQLQMISNVFNTFITHCIFIVLGYIAIFSSENGT
jgi:hypothetical protein